MVIKKKRSRLGEILISMGELDKRVLAKALDIGKSTRTRIGRVLLNMGIIKEQTLAKALATQFNIPVIDLSTIAIEPDVLEIIPQSTARRYLVIPYAMEGKELRVAMVDPVDVIAIDELCSLSGCRILPAVTAESELMKALNLYYGLEGMSAAEMADKVQISGVELLKEEEGHPEMLEKIAGETSIIKLVNTLVSQAVAESASDIHIEPDVGTLRVRMRIDGILREVGKYSIKLHPALISRIKILGDLNIAEKRLPQDGRFFVRIADRDIDVRLSTMPTIFGEKAVMRLLDKKQMVLDLEELTPYADSLEELKKIIKRPYGMILLTGPTGSGKTTTAYTLLNMLNSMTKNIVTVEDPVEYQLKIINQTQVNPKVGITFVNALRHLLRQDPDIVMIGEIRDSETADVAIQAALTGHLVISTVHTNNAIGSINRLLDMGIEPFLVSSAVICTVGQRLVRTLCKECRTPFTPEKALLDELGVPPGPDGKTPVFFHGKGCPACKGTGFKGRMGLYEIFIPNEDIRSMIARKETTTTITREAKRSGFTPLRAQGVRAVLEGLAAVEDVLLATHIDD